MPSIWLKAFNGFYGHKKSCWLDVQGQQELQWIEYQTFLE